MTFSEYLTKNRIKEDDFAAGDPKRYASWQRMYEQMHVNSFYISVKMVLNDVRNAFHLKEIPKAEKPAASETVARPVVRRAAATGSATQPASEAAQHDQPPASEPDLKANQPARPGRRAVIRKPAAEGETTAAEPITIPESIPTPEASKAKNAPATTENNLAEGENAAPKPVRARPVFKRPAREAAPSETPKSETEISGATPSETPAPATPKPGRARPVFKRPEAAATPAETPAESGTQTPTEQPAATETPAQPVPKPGRARSVFKRPDIASESVSTPGTQAAKPAEPENIASTADKPAAAEIKPEQPSNLPAPKPGRARPVFKRPDVAQQNQEEETATPAEAKNPVNSEQNQAPAAPAQPETEPPKSKPPQPRPVFKRPPPTEPPATENSGTE